jgi:sulfur carrier protein
MVLSINGDKREIAAPATVRSLLESLGLQSARVAVERNQQLVPRAEHDKTQLQDGDVLEIVHFVGGG